MRTVIRQKDTTARLVLGFHARHPDSSPASMASVHRLSGHLARVTELEGEQQRHQGLARSAQNERMEAEERLRRCYDQFVRLCRVVATQARVPDLHLPLGSSNRSTPSLLIGVEEAVRLSVVHALVLQHFGLPAELPLQMDCSLAAFNDADERRRVAQEASVALTPSIEREVEAAAVVVRHLDALNRIRFARDPEMLRNWSEVRRGGEKREGERAQEAAVSR